MARPQPQPPPPPSGAGCAAIAVPIIGPQFCVPYPADFAIVTKVMPVTDHGTIVVTDINGNFMFRVRDKILSLNDRRIIFDAAGNPIITAKQKIMTAHDRWQAFRGNSTDPSNLLFSVKRSSIIQFKFKLDVFLANNAKEKVCDFKIKGSWSEKSCTVYAGESSTIFAQMHKKNTVQSVLIGKDKFMVTVYPNIDYAFIATLIVILDDINKDDDVEFE